MVWVGGTDVLEIQLDEFATDTVVTVVLRGPSGQTPSVTLTPSSDKSTWTGTPTYDEAGRWVATWTITGTGAQPVEAQEIHVTDVPVAGADVPWRPTLPQVADYVVAFTLDVITPGDGIRRNTFDATTSPTNEQAHRLIDRAVTTITGSLGTVIEDAYPLAQTVAALRAAAAIARSFNRSSSDITLADSLDKRADAETKALIALNTANPEGDADLLPIFSFPCPPSYGDYTF